MASKAWIVHQEHVCPKMVGNQCCNRPMAIVNNNYTDGVIWRCPHPYQQKLSICSGTFIDMSKLKLSQIIDFVINWCYETYTYHTLMHECQLASEAIAKWRNLCRDICAEYFIWHPISFRWTRGSCRN